MRIWYDAPAAKWEDGVPLGNGRIGATPDGGVFHEQLVLNDITMWSGGPQDADKKDAHLHLKDIQQLLFAGRNVEAQELMERYFECEGPGSGSGNGANVPYGSYQLLGNLDIRYYYGQADSTAAVSAYRRALSLDDAVAQTIFTLDNTTYTRTYISSFADDVIAIRLSASQLHKIGFTIGMYRPERFTTAVSGTELQMYGQLNNGTDGKGVQYLARVSVRQQGGTLVAKGNTLQLRDANSAVIYISMGTDFRNPAYKSSTRQALNNARRKNFSALAAAHTAAYQKLFGRATLQLHGSDKDSLPTDRRLQAYVANPDDNGLAGLYFQYGRYLLISSARKNILPPNLQGLWANNMATAWNGDYHLDINIQMNHWPLDVTNLGMLNQPFLQLVEGLVKPGEKTAKAYYDAPGWVAHVITNVWGYTSPGEGYTWGAFNSGSAWLCQMLWSHYEFTKDTAYLRRLFPVLKGSAMFYLHYLVKEPSHGWLVTAPSNSPENAFIMPNGQQASVCMGPTIDNQIIRKLFHATISACATLKTDAAFCTQLEQAVTQLPPNQVAKDGRLMEWLEDYKEVEPHHRHLSHLWGLYPGDEIVAGTPLADAAKASLVARGDGGTGWSLAWKMNFWARLHDGNKALALFHRMMRPVPG
ncbi:MAG TPA: glycoside hydrolase family 95 protein, partial [Chitinophaga sp.]